MAAQRAAIFLSSTFGLPTCLIGIPIGHIAEFRW